MAGEIKYVGEEAIQQVITNVKNLLSDKQDTLTFDTTPTASSTNPVTSGGVLTALTGNGISAITNRGLSEEDFTSTLKTKLDAIASGAQVNVIESIKSGSTTFTISSKAVDIQGVANLTNYYTKTEINTLIGGITNITYNVVQTLPTASADVDFNTTGNIYLTPKSPSGTQNVYDEYICVHSENTYVWEKIGDTEVDLSGYVPTSRTIAGVDLADNVTKSELLTALNVADGAEVNVQPDWNQTNSSADDYIKNKPTIPTDTNQKIKTSSVTFGNDDVVQITAGTNVQVSGDATAKTITISATDTTYSSQSASQGGTAVSLVTTGEKYTWNNKQDAMTAITTAEIDAMF